MKVTVTFENDDGTERTYKFLNVEQPVGPSVGRTQFVIAPVYTPADDQRAGWPFDPQAVPLMKGAEVSLAFHAKQDLDECGDVYQVTKRNTRPSPVSMTSTMCWACGQMRGVVAPIGVFEVHSVYPDGSGGQCRGSGTDGPPEMRMCGYCARKVPLSATGRFERHLVGLVTVGGATAGRDCQGSGCAPEETTG